MRRILIVFLFVSTQGFGQLLLVRDPDFKNWAESINDHFVMQNGIERVLVSQKRKRIGQSFESLIDESQFLFDTTGRLIQLLQIKPLFGTRDSTLYTWKHSNLGVESEYKDGRCKRVIRTLDTENKVRMERYSCIVPNPTLSERATDSVLLETEFIETRYLNDTTVETLYFNEQKLPYKKVRKHKNSLGYPVRNTTTYLVTHQRIIREYYYNHLGKLKRLEIDNGLKNTQTLLTFEYNSFGNLSGFKEYENSKLVKSGEFVFDDLALPLGMVEHYGSSDEIMMYKFSYSYYKD